MGDGERICLRRAEVAGIVQLNAVITLDNLVGDGGDVQLRERVLDRLSVARAWARRLCPHQADEGPGGRRQRRDSMEISPVFDDENGCPGPFPWRAMVPENVSTLFCDGSTIPPQLTLRAPATASTSAARNRDLMSRFYTNR